MDHLNSDKWRLVVWFVRQFTWQPIKREPCAWRVFSKTRTRWLGSPLPWLFQVSRQVLNRPHQVTAMLTGVNPISFPPAQEMEEELLTYLHGLLNPSSLPPHNAFLSTQKLLGQITQFGQFCVTTSFCFFLYLKPSEWQTAHACAQTLSLSNKSLKSLLQSEFEK